MATWDEGNARAADRYLATTYEHVMPDVSSIVNWVKGKPVLVLENLHGCRALTDASQRTHCRSLPSVPGPNGPEAARFAPPTVSDAIRPWPLALSSSIDAFGSCRHWIGECRQDIKNGYQNPYRRPARGGVTWSAAVRRPKWVVSYRSAEQNDLNGSLKHGVPLSGDPNGSFLTAALNRTTQMGRYQMVFH